MLVRGFIGRVKVEFKAVVARGARRCLLSGTKLRAKGYMFTLNQKESFLEQPKSERKVNMSREGNRDTLKIECMLKPRDAQSVTSLMSNHELENARRALRLLKTGQHEHKRETAERENVSTRKTYSRENGTCNTRSEVRDVSQRCEEWQHIHAEQLQKQHTLTFQ